MKTQEKIKSPSRLQPVKVGVLCGPLIFLGLASILHAEKEPIITKGNIISLQIQLTDKPDQPINGQKVLVMGTGMIQVSGLKNEIQAVGLTSSQLAEVIQRAFTSEDPNLPRKIISSPPVPIKPEQIKAGDFLVVTIPLIPEQTKEWKEVSASGFISLPRLKQKIFAAGLRPVEFSKEADLAYIAEKILLNPQVQTGWVCVKDYSGPPTVTVCGEVKLQGEIPAEKGLTLMAAIERFGGFTEGAKRRKVKVIHKNGKFEVFDLREILKDGSNNPQLQNWDTVIVPEL